ncbi:3-hydroxyacyl-CoA dehydrogenase family protein [Alicyclobacillus dauci]|uniref:3-hydroxyacyl-CoA dehydrogenase family protein n=1 Tax=Alicyclobacillus dauci TaxID=1475485 RepID=A0ABY6Z2I7_9BACL|nr:3-hydroxyacyl-CoA dehydrogenase family protein [Alicyclobacillus dauci]WAH36200.1 3-hydroxyacyl-CoA dehydrogenase family protein [Alicyclobacillus dauci]
MKVLLLGATDVSRCVLKACLKSRGIEIFVYDPYIEELDDANSKFKHSLPSLHRLKNIEFLTEIPFDLEPDLVIDCLPDDSTQGQFLEEVDGVLNSHPVYITTSKLYSVSELSRMIEQPEKMIGMQFVLPFDEIEFVEIVRGMRTSQATIDVTTDFVQHLSKKYYIVKDVPGYVLNRMLLVVINEAVSILHEGLATPQQVDETLRHGLGMKKGALQLADEIGLNRVVKMANAMASGLNNSRYQPHYLLLDMVNSGLTGKEMSSGFYSYLADILDFPYLST